MGKYINVTKYTFYLFDSKQLQIPKFIYIYIFISFVNKPIRNIFYNF